MKTCIPESKETPKMEAANHSKKFLNKAAKLTEKKASKTKTSPKKK